MDSDFISQIVDYEDYLFAKGYNNKWYRKFMMKEVFASKPSWYSKFLCSMNLYTIYTDKRCQWCGVPHIKKDK